MIRNILFVSSPKTYIGGGETYLLELASGLRKYFNIHFVDGGKSEFQQAVKLHGYQCTEIDLGIFPNRRFRDFLCYCRDNRIELIHFNNRRDIILAFFARMFLKVPVVLTMHTTILSRYLDLKDQLKNLFYIILYRVFGRALNACITLTDYNGVLLKKIYGIPGERVAIIRNGVAVAKPGDVDVDRGSSSAFLIISVAHLTRLKGIDVLLRSLSKIRSPGWRCVIIGGGDELGGLLDLARRLGVVDKVTFTGPLPREEVLKFVAKSNVLVLPTWFEAFPYSVLEAMSFGVPVITTRILGLPEIVDDGLSGVLVPPGDHVALAAAIENMMEHPDRARDIGLRGFERVQSVFSKSKMLDETKSLYFRLLGK